MFISTPARRRLLQTPAECLAIHQTQTQTQTQLPRTARSFASTPFRRQDPNSKQRIVTTNYTEPPTPRGRGNTNQLPILPLVAIFFTGSFLFWRLLKQREGQGQSHYVLPPRDNRPQEH